MPRDGAIMFRDIVGKLDVLNVECDKCGHGSGITLWLRPYFETPASPCAHGASGRMSVPFAFTAADLLNS
jgi:hypothetical protein